MKLYARLHNSKRKVEGIGDDTRIMIEITYKNQVLGILGLYTIFGAHSTKGIGARLVWKNEHTPIQGTVIEEYSEIKGKQQKDEICNFNACKNKAVKYGVCEKHLSLEQ